MADTLFEHFGFTHTPFTQDVPTASLLETPSTEVIQTKLRMAAERKLFAVLSGGIGTGKSTQLRVFAKALPADAFKVLYVACSGITPRGIYTHILKQLGVSPAHFINELRWQLKEELGRIERAAHQTVVVIIDEAHLLDAGHRRRIKDNCTTEEIRYLRNSDYDAGSPLALILAGQPEIWDELHLGSAENRAIAQRIDLTCKTETLGESEVAGYIAAHLRYAGVSPELFEESAVKLLAKKSGGVPRVINKLCTQALLYTAVQKGSQVSEDTVATMLSNGEFPQCALGV